MARVDDAESAKKIRKVPQTTLCGVAFDFKECRTLKKRIAAVLCAACLVLSLLAGCGSTESYPAVEELLTAASESSANLGTASNDTVSVSYASDAWTGMDDTDPLTVYYTETMYDAGTAVNINVQPSGTYSGKLTKKTMEQLVEALQKNFPTMEIESAELRTLDGSPVIYMESVLNFTEESLDNLVESGAITEDYIESIGGREAILAIPPTDQLTLYAVNGAYLYIYTGTYYDESQKDAVLSCMITMAQTTEQAGT